MQGLYQKGLVIYAYTFKGVKIMPYIDMEEVRILVENYVRSEFGKRFPPRGIDRIEIRSMNMQGVADKRVCNVHGYIMQHTILNQKIDFYAQVRMSTSYKGNRIIEFRM